MNRPRVVMVINAEWYFLSHRLPLAKALQAQGFEVIVVASIERGCRKNIEDQGFRFIPLRLQRRSQSLITETVTFLQLATIYRNEKPDLVHHFTVKPVLYGSWAAKLTGVPAVVNTIPGRGYVFSHSGWHQRILRQLVSLGYRLALSGSRVRVIFQNPDDLQSFLALGLVGRSHSKLIRGSGVDVNRFVPAPERLGTPIILLAARLLWDKGVKELVEASRLLKQKQIACRVVIVGVPDLENPDGVPASVLTSWQNEGLIEWWGLRDDMPAILHDAALVVLPTVYPEGVPKILLEAAAAGRPIVTTDVPGCREIVHHGENGLLIPPRDHQSLAQAIEVLLNDPGLRKRMGRRGRQIVLDEFSEDQVIKETFRVYRELLGCNWPGAT